MIVLFKDNKIIGADKKLLNQLSASLDNLSQIISELELIIASKQNNSISIHNNFFNIEEIPIVSIENIKAFNLIKSEKETVDLENELLNLNINQENELKEIKLQEPFEELETSTDNNTLTFETKPINEPIQTIQEPNFQEIKINEEIKPIIPEEEIKISFEDNFDEINSILSLNQKEANKLIAEELKKASEDLGIDYKMIHDLYNDLIKQFNNEKKNFYNAIEKNDYEKIHKTAHTLKGAALNLRLSKLGLILKYIDEESKMHKPIEQLKFLIDKFYAFVNKIENNKQTEIPEGIKNLILLTIKEYLATQNEKKFKKDLKYIEKLLNTKINSLEDLQELVKE